MNWNIQNKILAGFAVSLAVLLVVGITAITGNSGLLAAMEARRHSFTVLLELSQLLNSLVDAETGQRGYLITGQDEYLEPYFSGTKQANASLRGIRELTADNSAQQRRLDEIEPLVASKLADMKEKIDLRASKTIEEVQQAMAGNRGKQLMDEIRRLVGAMRGQEETLLDERSKASVAAAQRLKFIIGGTTLAAFAGLAFLGVLMARHIAGPLQSMTTAATRIAGGDFAVEIPPSARTDEAGTLSRAFARMCATLQGMAGVANRVAGGDLSVEVRPLSDQDALGRSFQTMTEGLRSLIGEILEAVGLLGTAAREILASTSEMAASAAETAAAVTETTTTVEEVKQTSQISSEKARFVSNEAQKAAEVSQNGKRAVGETIEGMNGIRQQMSAVAESILGLSAQGQAIGDIIATVDDLAAQSRLLAVNASIEAAKAGEEGKGFSVVAQEVRTLAEQSRQATTQVRGILNDIQKATSSAVLATEMAMKTVEIGVRQSTAANDSISVLADNVSGAAQAATQIAATSQEQFVGMDQVALAMENIKVASTQTLTSTRQAEAAARQLHELGQKLGQLVARFKV